ncbi:hypothetical protein BAT_1716 [Bacillus pumilus ATCC 7061]|nr:hypothetical protein BAT_1716 [Bacillus pumilus ATCC 7061]
MCEDISKEEAESTASSFIVNVWCKLPGQLASDDIHKMIMKMENGYFTF